MSMNPSTLSVENRQSPYSKWDISIDEAKNEIKHLNQRVSRLRLALEIFEKNKKEGVIWPGMSKSTDIEKDLS
jgi:hypothetical protein